MKARVGIIGRMDFTGLGIQSKEFFDHIPCKALVIDSSKLNTGSIQNPHWYPGQTFVLVDSWLKIKVPVIDDFLSNLDVVFAFETPYDYTIFERCKRFGIKTILQPNYEFLDYPSKHPMPDLFACPSAWHYDKIPGMKTLLPVPVNTKHFVPKLKPNTFVHVAGKQAVYDRNGTETFLESLRYVKSKITAIVRGQHNIPFVNRCPPNVTLQADFTGREKYWENFDGGVTVLPRKYGGLSLVVNESLAAEMPVIMTNISPNNEWLPQDWLVQTFPHGSFVCKQKIEVHEANTRALAERIDHFCIPEFYERQVKAAREIKETISWDALLPQYMKVLES